MGGGLCEILIGNLLQLQCDYATELNELSWVAKK